MEGGSQTVMLARDEEMGDGVQPAPADAAHAAEGEEVADREVCIELPDLKRCLN